MKTFFRSLSGLVIIALLAAIILLFLAWSRVPDILAGNLSKKLKVMVEIGDIDLSLRSITVDKLEIGNPSGYYLPRAFACDKIFVDSPLTRYFSEHIEIDEIDLDNVYLGLEFDSPSGTKGNWTALMQNAKAAQEAGKNEKSKRSVLIRRLVLNNIRTDLIYRNQGDKVRHLPVIKRIELKNISSEGGNVMDQIMNSALGEMLKEVFMEQNLKEFMDKIFQPGGNNPIPDAIKQFRGFFNASYEAKEPEHA
jgi:uncharacterized protein involved in outer membrane biogenesis